jgi:hypothetical protein
LLTLLTVIIWPKPAADKVLPLGRGVAPVKSDVQAVVATDWVVLIVKPEGKVTVSEPAASAAPALKSTYSDEPPPEFILDSRTEAADMVEANTFGMAVITPATINNATLAKMFVLRSNEPYFTVLLSMMF